MNSWSHLPNAAHIDRIIDSVNKCPEIWRFAYWELFDPKFEVRADSVMGMPRLAEEDLTPSNINFEEMIKIWDKVRSEAFSIIFGFKRNREPTGLAGAGWKVTSQVLFTLVVYDNSGHYLNLSYEKLKFIADLTGLPAPRLLLPAVRAFEFEKLQKDLV